jgi:DNA polymerase-3 subunit beta
MKISIDKQLLLDSINIASKAVSSRTTQPILECLLLTAEDNGIRLYGNDLRVGIKTAEIPARVDERGSVAINCKMFSDIVKKMPGDLITIESNPQNVVFFKSDRTQMKLLGQNAIEYPTLPEVEVDKVFSLSAAKFREMIRQTIFSAAVVESKPILTGELMQINGGSLNLVAVDGFRIAFRKIEDEHLDPDAQFEVVVPAASLSELMKLLPADGNDVLKFHFTEKHILFELPTYTLTSRLLEGEFLKYSQIFNDDFSTYVRLSRQELLDSLELAFLLGKEDKQLPVRLEVQSDKVLVTSNGERGASYNEVMGEIDGNELEIAFNPKYLIDALRVVTDKEITLTFTGSLSPLTIRSIDSDAYKYLILPLRLKA